MIIERLYLKSFRNYTEVNLRFSPHINVLIGENAQGKTNLLEGIYLMATGKSFRSGKDKELIKMEEEGFYNALSLRRMDGQEKTIEIGVNRLGQKRMKINGVPLDRQSDLFGNLNVVIFSPEDLKIIKEGPAYRRDFMDHDLSQISPKYHYHLQQYQRVLRQRNQSLKLKAYRSVDLEPWNIQLAQYGVKIMRARSEFIHRVAILTKLMHRKITKESENIKLSYVPDLPMKEKEDETALIERFIHRLKENEKDEVGRGTSLTGPHRDDLLFEINGKDVKKYGSQGQTRTSVLSLKMAELEVIKGETGEYPVLLLDDVLSELDDQRQRDLLLNLKNIQTFITTTSLEKLEGKIEMDCYRVVEGEVENF